MSPEDRQLLNDIKTRLDLLERVENIAFIRNVFRRLEDEIDEKIAGIKLNDLADVDTSGVTNGQVIKYTASTSTWENAADNT